MALQIKIDGAVVYDSRLEEYTLTALKTTTGTNKGGTLELTMPPGHPAYNSFISFRSVVELYDDKGLQFRGRALYPLDDFNNNRTIMCEGERCFLRDGVIRPYLYQDTPAAIFAAGLALYNAQVDSFKRFTLGAITVTDPNDYIRLESESAETFAEFFDKLVKRCGGYITFTDDGNGGRAINWLAEIGTRSTQTIEFGENLLDFSRSGESQELATAVLPYGAQLEDGTRVTIASVTEDGADYIQDNEAVALRGFIMATVTFDDVTEPENLLRKAKQWLAEHRLAVTTLQLSAVDLSRWNLSIDSFHDGDLIPVSSAPHNVDDDFQLTERVTDWLSQDGGSITLGKTRKTLTGEDVQAQQAMKREVIRVRSEVLTITDIKMARIESSLSSKIEQTSTSILLEVSEKYTTKDELSTEVRSLTSKIEQTSESILLEVSEKYTTKDELSTEVRSLTSKIEQLAGSITLEVSGTLGGTASIVLKVDGNEVSQELDMTEVRKAFANDTTAVAISAGTITFNSGTIVINSGNFKVTSAGAITATSGTIGAITLSTTGIYSNNASYSASYAGWYRPATITTGAICFFAGATSATGAGAKFSVTYGGELTATEATITGDIITTDDPYKARLYSGGLGLYFDDVLCGTIKTKYHSSTSDPGITLRVEDGGKYIMFVTPNSESGNGFEVDYYLNNGWSDFYTEKHIFQSSARFLDRLEFNNGRSKGLYMYEGYFIKSCDDEGTALEEMLGYRSDMVYVGSVGCATMLRGTTVYLKNTSTTVTSDRNAKRDIEQLPDVYESFIDGLEPVRFKYKEGTSGRYHVGYIAQDVETALTGAGLSTQDFAGYVKMSDELGLSYDEFIAILHKKIKRLEQRIATLEKGATL